MVSITLFGMILIMKYVSLIKSTHKDLFFDKSRGLFSMSNWEFDGVKCFANVLSNVVSWVIGWCYTGSFLDGLILGAYISLPAYMAVSGVLTALFGNGRT